VEKLYTELLNNCRAELGDDHPQTLKIMVDLASVMAEQERREDAVKLLETALAGRVRVLGEDHPDTRRTREATADHCGFLAWALLRNTPPTRANAERAGALARRAMALGGGSPLRRPLPYFDLADAQYRLGDPAASLQTLQEALRLNQDWAAHWFLLAIVHARLGEKQLGRDWFIAAHERGSKEGGWFDPNARDYELQVQGRQEASAVGLPEAP
jgi:tetratricopeptide (TPR) repeat protein